MESVEKKFEIIFWQNKCKLKDMRYLKDGVLRLLTLSIKLFKESL